MESFLGDLRFAWRSLWRSPSFTLVAMLVLALGVGATVAIVSMGVVVYLDPLPFEEEDKVLLFWQSSENYPKASLSLPTYWDTEERSRHFESVALFNPTNVSLIEGSGEPIQLSGHRVTHAFLDAMGIQPVLGRGFVPEADHPGATRTILLSDRIWRLRFASDPGILGRILNLEGETYEVIGILPSAPMQLPLMDGLKLGDFLVPIGPFIETLPKDNRNLRMGFFGVARLEDGVDVEFAQKDLERIGGEILAENPLSFKDQTLGGDSIRNVVSYDSRASLLPLAVAVGLMLLVGGVNLINLFLVRLGERRSEIASRMALGATSGRIVRQVITEGVVLAGVAGVGAVIVGWLGVRLLRWQLGSLPLLAEARYEPGLIVLTLFLCLFVVLLILPMFAFGVIRNGAVQLASGLEVRSLQGPGFLGKGLVVFELVLALLAVMGTSLLLGSLQNVRQQDPGFTVENIHTFQMLLPKQKYLAKVPWITQIEQIERRVGALPGVEGVAWASPRPMSWSQHTIVAAGDRPLPEYEDMLRGYYFTVSPTFFEIMGIPLIEGQLFDSGDDDRAGDAERVAIINNSLAQTLWTDSTAVGQEVIFEFDGPVEDLISFERRVVGVVEDVRHESLKMLPRGAIYVPYTQRPLYFEGSSTAPAMTLFVKSREPVSVIVDAVRQEILEIDPEQAIADIDSMEAVVQKEIQVHEIVALLVSSLALIAVLLAFIGVYGLISYIVAANTREIGLRMALGAAPKTILRELVTQSLRLVALAMVFGGAILWALPKVLSSELAGRVGTYFYGVESSGVLFYVLVCVILAIVTIAASLVPALRAMRIDPAQTLAGG